MSESQEHLLQTTVLWFKRARPLESLTTKHFHVQLGVHFEEVSEMLEQLNGLTDKTRTLIVKAFDATKALADHLKTSDGVVEPNDMKLILDSLCDQIVTATGVGYMMGSDVVGAMREVNRANWSKFDSEGNPLFDDNGKVLKGPNYKIADLTPFV
jgi:predicted HAD superfamily Cof-like phosphohydrolase